MCVDSLRDDIKIENLLQAPMKINDKHACVCCVSVDIPKMGDRTLTW